MKTIKATKHFNFTLTPKYKTLPRTVEGFIKKFSPCELARDYLRNQKTLKKAFKNLRFKKIDFWAYSDEWLIWLVEQLYSSNSYISYSYDQEDFYKLKKHIGNPWENMEE